MGRVKRVGNGGGEKDQRSESELFGVLSCGGAWCLVLTLRLLILDTCRDFLANASTNGERRVNKCLFLLLLLL